jgi:ABC-type amino acid transport substrate-binding protein
VFVHDAPIILQLALENEDKNLKPVFSVFLTEEYLAWGIRREDAAMLSAANRFLDAIKKDGRLMQMVKRWIPLAN